MTVDLSADSQTTIRVPHYTYATLPAAGTQGRLAYVTDTDIGLYIDTGSTWSPLNTYAPPSVVKGSLPTAGTTGRLRYVTDDLRGLWADTGHQWFAVGNGVANVQAFGATGDGSTHLLSTRYASNALANAAYPLLAAYLATVASSIDITADTIDWAAIMEALLAGNACVPPGTYVINRPIAVPNGRTLLGWAGIANYQPTIQTTAAYTSPNVIQNYSESNTTAAGLFQSANGMTSGHPYVSVVNLGFRVAAGVTVKYIMAFDGVAETSQFDTLSFYVPGTVQSYCMGFVTGGSLGQQNFTVRNTSGPGEGGTCAGIINLYATSGATVEKHNWAVDLCDGTVEPCVIDVADGYVHVRDINFEGTPPSVTPGQTKSVLHCKGDGLVTVEHCQFACRSENWTAINFSGSVNKPYVVRSCHFDMATTGAKIWNRCISVTGSADAAGKVYSGSALVSATGVTSARVLKDVFPEGLLPNSDDSRIFVVHEFTGARTSVSRSLAGGSADAYVESVTFYGACKQLHVYNYAHINGGLYTAGDLIWSAADLKIYRCTGSGAASGGAWSNATAYAVGAWADDGAGNVYRAYKTNTNVALTSSGTWQKMASAVATFSAGTALSALVA